MSTGPTVVLDFYGPHGRDFLNCLKAGGATGIARYLTNNRNDPRQITPQEVADAHAAGLEIHFFYEGNSTFPGYFTYPQGIVDCGMAVARLTELNAPLGTVVYFAVDVNLDPNITIPYFNAIEATKTVAITPGGYGYQRMCEFARSQFPNIGSHVAQTYGQPTGSLDLWQHLQEQRCGVQVDVNDCFVDGWKPEGGSVTAPSYVGQSVTNVSLTVGQVGQIDGVWHYPSGDRHIIEKVYGTAPGFWPYTMYPPVDPDADPTKVLSAQPAYFVISVR